LELNENDIPVYLFTGFLESGKTKFIQETLCDERFNKGEKTLLLVCEEGVEEYEPDEFSGENVFIKIVEEESELSEELLRSFIKETDAERGRIVYLTFDDGPCENTARVLEILEQYNVRATFFTVGRYVDKYPETAKQIVDAGQLIACHSYSHDYDKIYASADAFMKEVRKWEDAVQRACGALPERVCVRFPGGSSIAKDTREDIIAALFEGTYRAFDWNAGNNDRWLSGNTTGMSTREWLEYSYNYSMNKFNNNTNASVIFILHDTSDLSVEMLPWMIEDLLARGYRFETLDNHTYWNAAYEPVV
jgi:peptidoglycan/xylan/chitin deacetylase (PgdA/CDA1 family)